MNRRAVEFYYTRHLPQRSVAVAYVRTNPLTPAQLTDINNVVLNPGTLGVWKSTTLDASPADFVAPDLNVSLAISGATQYRLDNQFFEITSQSLSGVPLFYVHTLEGDNVQDVAILDLAGNIVPATFSISGNKLYHDMDGAAYRVRYISSDGYLRLHLLRYDPVLTIAPFAPSATTYVFSGRYLTVATTGTLYLRFLAGNGYQVLPPYSTPPNTPWFSRVRFPIRPVTPEWARQVFLPQRPYVLGTWVPGVVLDNKVVEFERKNMLLDREHLPDLLVFDKDYAFKYALEGTRPGSPRRRGSLYNWKRGLVALENVDWYKGRIEVGVELALDDIVFGFYSYVEPDVIYRGIDCNPFTNPSVRNKIVEFYYKVDGTEPFNRIFHRVKDPATGTYVVGATNDTNPGVTGTLFATLVVGASVGTQQFTIDDLRARGGGLSPEWQDIPEAVNFWDLGFWDGKPYPIGGALIVYLPVGILDRMTRSDIENRVRQTLPVGTSPVLRFYSPTGEETV